MAKSVRASVSKRNSAKLRATVFGPVVDARTARLSAKLQELASQPKPAEDEIKVKAIKTDEQDKSTEAPKPEASEDMDIDRATEKPTKSRSAHSHKSGRIQKRHKKITFASNAKKSSSKRK